MTPPMRPIPRPDRLTLQVGSVALVGVALAMARSAGLAADANIADDAIDLVAAARNALAGTGLLQVNGEPLASQPPLFPLLLFCVASLGGDDPLAAVRLVNLSAFGLTIFIVGNTLRRHLESPSLVIWACLAIALSIPLADIASRGLAEPLFILLATLALMQANVVLTNGRLPAVCWTGVLSGLAWLTSHAGVAVVAAIGLVLLLQRGVSWPLRRRRVAVFGLCAALPMCLWALRNYLVIGVWAPVPQWTERDLWDVISAIGSAVGEWASFDLALVAWPDSVALDMLVAFALLGLVGFVLVRFVFDRERRLRRSPSDWRLVWSFGSFGLIHLAVLVAVGGWWYSPFGDHAKYVAPLYVPLVMVVTFALDWLLRLERKTRLLGSVPSLSLVLGRGSDVPSASAETPPQRHSVLLGVLTATLAVWTAGQVMPNAQAIASQRESGSRLLRSETLQYIRDNPVSGTVYSNHVGLVYLHNGDLYNGELATYVALGGHSASRTSFSVEKPLKEAADGTHVIWFDRYDRGYPFSLPSLRGTPGLAPVVDLADGAIFRMDRLHTTVPNPLLDYFASVRAGALGEPEARSTFDIYLDGRTLIYIKSPCSKEDVRGHFFLHFTDANSVGGLDFDFQNSGALLEGDTCVMAARLPDQPIFHIRTGQIYTTAMLWQAEPDVSDLAVASG